MIQTVISVLSGFLQISLFALISPAIVGTLWWAKARLQLRRGPPPWQLYFDLIKLLRIGPGRRPETTSWIYVITPFTIFICYALLGWAAPPLYPSFPSLDLIVVVYLLGLARFSLALAGMDASTSFSSMGSSREMFLNVLAEPLLILFILALARQRHTTDLISIISRSSLSSSIFNLAALSLLWLTLAFVALMDNGFLPIDNPSTHLELTMIQKAPHLEYSGRNLALIEWGEAMRLTFFLTLLGDLLIAHPSVSENALVPLLFIAKLLIAIVLLALFEITQIRLRLRRVVIPWVTMLLLSVAAVFLIGIH